MIGAVRLDNLQALASPQKERCDIEGRGDEVLRHWLSGLGSF